MSVRTSKYERYMASLDWQIKRREALAAASHECQRCDERSGLEVHHRTYDRLGDERLDDLEVLCGVCHRVADEERRVATRRKSEQSLWDARLAGWATKRWGDDWGYYPGVEVAEEAFEAWLEDLDE